MCMIFFSITCFIQIATSYLEAREGTFTYKIFAGLGNGMWVISQVCHYLVFINRLFYTFEGTKYEISQRTLFIYPQGERKQNDFESPRGPVTFIWMSIMGVTYLLEFGISTLYGDPNTIPNNFLVLDFEITPF